MVCLAAGSREGILSPYVKVSLDCYAVGPGDGGGEEEEAGAAVAAVAGDGEQSSVAAESRRQRSTEEEVVVVHGACPLLYVSHRSKA